MASTMEEDWDDWEADDEVPASSAVADAAPSAAAASPRPLASELAPAEPLGAAVVAAKPVHSDSRCDLPVAAGATGGVAADEDDSDTADSESDSWTWSFARMERDVRRLEAQAATQAHVAASNSSSDRVEDVPFEHIMRVAEQVATGIRTGQARVVTLEALALVTKLHLLAVRQGFGVEQHAGDAMDQVPAIVARLQAIAPDWTIPPTKDEDAHQQLQELTAVLHHALTACSGDLAPFQQVLEQVMVSQSHETLVISVAWIRPRASAADAATCDRRDQDPLLRASPYLQHLEAITDPSGASPLTVAVLTEAEAFQDAKDIARDDLVVNGAPVSGARGYGAVVETLQQQIERALHDHIGLERQGGDDDAQKTATQAIAKQILNACNRTESGGSSYEILSKFLSNHAMDAILIRPDSAKAAPLVIDVDVGAFGQAAATSSGAETRVWAFGVRVVVAAVTTYVVCDADDPTTELYEVKTTYTNRLAFPLDLTPFHPLNAMRRDCGAVAIQLVQPSPSPLNLAVDVGTCARSGDARRHELTPALDQTVEFDDLL